MKLFILFILLSYSFIFVDQANVYAQSFNWAKDITGSDYNSGNRIKVDTDGNSYITGQFTGTANFNDNIHLTSFVK
jgi:hypothetical protein